LHARPPSIGDIVRLPVRLAAQSGHLVEGRFLPSRGPVSGPLATLVAYPAKTDRAHWVRLTVCSPSTTPWRSLADPVQIDADKHSGGCPESCPLAGSRRVDTRLTPIEVAKEGLGPRLAFLADLPYAWRAVGILEPWGLLGARAKAHDDALKPREITDGGSGT
jgi:hypothetical protein